MLLGLSGYTDPRWLTYRKATDLGGHVRKGEKSRPVALWKPVEREDDDGETKVYWLFRYYSVFNVGQCDDLISWIWKCPPQWRSTAFLCHESGIENTVENSTAYIAHLQWVRKVCHN